MFVIVSRRLLTSFYPKLTSSLWIKHFGNNIRIISQRDHYFRPKHSPKFKNRKETSPGSRYVPPSWNELAEEIAKSELHDKSFMSEEEWDEFKSNLIDSTNCVSEETFGPIVMDVLMCSNQLDLSHCLIKYLEQSNLRPNFLTYLKYISLCSRNHRIVDQKLILKIIEKVKAEIDASPVLDMKRAEYIIQGLCVTDRWKESFKYLPKLIQPKPSREICCALACAAIRNNDEMLAWEILKNWMNCYEAVSDKVIEEFLLVALKMQKSNSIYSEKYVLKVFNYMQTTNVIISLDVAKLIEQYFRYHHMKWDITYTKVSRSGVCATCSHLLKPSYLKNEEFNALCEAFLERSVMKSDLFINTNSEEFMRYMKFIDLHKPFHMVVDGLNAAHSFKGIQNRKNISYHLTNIVRILTGKSRNVLILGRKHMKSWPKYRMDEICHKAKIFFTDNISEDDPFVIYAALASGPHTLFLSDDLMRDHLSRLQDPKLIYLFKKWQLSHQVFLECNEENDINLIEPVRHSIAVHGDMESGWHIPFDDKIILDPYEELNNWLCIKKVM